jgi:hypothetical protein
MSHSKTKNHGQAFWGVVAALAVVALVYTSFNDRVGGQVGALPAAPKDFAGVATRTGVDLSWTPPTGAITGYVLEYGPVIRQVSMTTVNIDRRANTHSIPSIAWNEGPHEFALYATNANGSGQPATIIIEPLGSGGSDEVRIRGLDVSVSGTTASFSWDVDSSDKDIYGKISYSLVKDMTRSKPITVLENRGSYSADISSLLACTQYWYTVQIIAEADRGDDEILDSESGTFKVYGCKGESEMLSVMSDRVTPSQSNTISLENGNSRLTVVTPTGAAPGAGVFVQAAKLERDKVESDISVPSGRTWVGESAYSIKAMVNENVEFSNGFDNPVEVSMEYNVSDISGLDEESLTIWHYENGNGWMPLNSCVRERSGSTGTVTCLTGSFSIFGLFGQEEEQGGNGGDEETPPTPPSQSSSGSTVVGSVAVLPTQPTQPVAPTQTTPSTSNKFTRNLWRGVTHNEVKILQETLNKLGFTVSSSGAGSTGSETTFFGPLTEQAVIRFQEAYMEQVLAPFGLRSGTGYFGQLSRNMMESLMGN